MARRKKKHVITVEEVVYELLRHAAEGDTWTFRYDEHHGDLDFAGGYGLGVNDDTCEIWGVQISPVGKSECVQEFSFELIDGLEFSTTVKPGEKPVWKPSVELPFLYYKDESTKRFLLGEMSRLLDECVELEMFDPAYAWCPESFEDIAPSDISELMDSEARYFFKWDPNPDGIDETSPDHVCICRSDDDLEKIMRNIDAKSAKRRTTVRETTFDEAAKWLRGHGVADEIEWDRRW